MKLIMKFGGTSVADGNKIKHVAELVKSYRDRGDQIAVVTSALGGITDIILNAANDAVSEGKVSQVKEFVADITKKHHQAVHDAVSEEFAEDVIAELDARIEEIEKALTGICYLGELTPRSIDYLSSYGERLAAPILSASIRTLGVESQSFAGGAIGIITDDNYGAAHPLESTYAAVGQHIEPLMENTIPVITGFIGESEHGTITTLGRGGSDFTASIVGAAVNADEIWLWKEVHGIMTTDPKIVPEARPLPIISYIEAMEMSFFGAKVLHPKAIEPAIRQGIPVRVKNTFDPEYPGTLVVKNEETSQNIVKAVSVMDKVALINISGAGMVGTIGVAAREFRALADAGVNIKMISQGSSEANLSTVVDESHMMKAVWALKQEFKNGVVGEIEHDVNISVVAVVGVGMAGTPGVAGRVFGALGGNGVNVIMISQGSSQHNISFVVKKDTAAKAVQVLHKEFELEKL